MTKLAILNSDIHRTARVFAEPSAEHGDNRRFAPVVIREFPVLATYYPILFSKDSETGAFYCGAMFGFDEHENLFLDQQQKHRAYRPLSLQRAPFHAVGKELAIDLDHPRVVAEGGQALFDDAGAPTAYLEGVFTTMRELVPGVEMTNLFIDTLLKLKLIESVQINVGFDDGENLDLAGLYTIDQDALRALPDAAVIDLFRRGYLNLIYLMVGSLKQIPVLAQRKNDRILDATAGLAGL